MSIEILEKESVRELVLPLSVETYHKLGELGALPEKLMEGLVIQKKPKNPKYTEVLQRLFKLFFVYFGEEFEIRKEEPIALGNSLYPMKLIPRFEWVAQYFSPQKTVPHF